MQLNFTHGLVVACLTFSLSLGCSATDDPSVAVSSAAAGGGGWSDGGHAETSQGGSGGESNSFPCGIDCSTIATADCNVAVCDMTMLSCVVVDAEDGASCDDGLFCTVDDSCQQGICQGGGDNTCGVDAGPCDDIFCDETVKQCSTQPKANGGTCTASDLCQVGATCTDGLCVGTANDCFFAPTPDDCHVAVCNPANGECEPLIGNEGESCVDLNDLCTDNKTCSNGVCGGGAPKDCSNLTVGCVNGVCNPSSGVCEAQAVPQGGLCAEGDDQCTAGICDMNGVCTPTPTNEGLSCDDFNACNAGELCSAGSCVGGGPVTACTNNDGCCPSGCTVSNDIDCACGIDKLQLKELNIGSTDYIAIHNPTVCPLNLDGVGLLFDDSSLSDVVFDMPAQILGAGADVYVVEASPVGDDIALSANIPFSGTRAGSVVLCVGACEVVVGANVVDVIQWEGVAPSVTLPSSLNFAGGPLTGLTSSNESTMSYLRQSTLGQYPNFFAADWALAPKTK